MSARFCENEEFKDRVRDEVVGVREYMPERVNGLDFFKVA